jgi:DNA-binding transcriptional ArsR family regulator
MLDQTIDLDRTFQALADKSRRSMVERLTLGPASVSQLAEPLAMSLAAVVQHVQVLEACGVVKTEKVGRTRMCRIESAAMSAAEQWITDRRRGWEARMDRLGDVLNEETARRENP